ncbi:MAG: serine/threonine protein kinase [Lachnospiraceae bacterium]|nr:serine/threonine protein kinase [Lachnospiraceae bacterium]
MLKVGTVLDGKYRILSEVGRGGMSVVYLAQNVRANKNWAVKELRKNGSAQYDVVKQNLIVETEILKRLDNPHLPSIVDVIDMDDAFVIVMDYVEGSDLGEFLKDGQACSEKDVVDWGKQLCDVLAYLHSQNPPIIYRDMKPSNVRLRPDGVIMLLDFGTAREYKSRYAGDDTTCLGTRGYAAPEQYGGQGQTDARTDIYNLGATLYHLVTGRNPGEPPYEMVPIRQVNPALSDGLEKVILTCTRPNPQDRYQNCAELWDDLDHLNEIGRKAQSTRKRKLAAFFSCLGLCAFGGISSYFFTQLVESENVASYEENLKSAETANWERTGLDENEITKIQYYQAAVGLYPARSEAYTQFLEELTYDAEFTEDEWTMMSQLLLTDSNGTAGEIYFQEENLDEYLAFEYSLGLQYLAYGTNNSTSTSVWKNARTCFRVVMEQDGETYRQEVSTALYYILSGLINNSSIEKKSDAEYITELLRAQWAIELLDDFTDYNDNFRLRLYLFLVNMIGMNAENYRSGLSATSADIQEALDNEELWQTYVENGTILSVSSGGTVSVTSDIVGELLDMIGDRAESVSGNEDIRTEISDAIDSIKKTM